MVQPSTRANVANCRHTFSRGNILPLAVRIAAHVRTIVRAAHVRALLRSRRFFTGGPLPRHYVPTLRLAPILYVPYRPSRGLQCFGLLHGLYCACLQSFGLTRRIFVNARRVFCLDGFAGILAARLLCRGTARAGVGPRRARPFTAFRFAG